MKELEEKIKQLKEKKAEVEKKFNEDCKQLELEKKECYAQNSKLQTLIKEKEKVTNNQIDLATQKISIL